MDYPPPQFYRFDSFRVDAADRRLFRDDVEVPLSPKVFDTLLVLLEKPGQLVGKDELMERLWPGTFVGEDALAQKISLLRKALNGGNGPDGYISTVPKLGYRFTGEVTHEDPKTDRAEPLYEIGESAAPPELVAAAKKRNVWLVAGMAIVGAFCVLGAAWLAAGHSASVSTTNYRIKKLDVFNALLYGVISLDGKYLAYVCNENGKQSLWVRPVASAGKGLQVVPAIAGAFWGVTFSPDQAYLYYVLAEATSSNGVLYRINTLGGSPERLVDGVDGPVAFAPSGQRMVYKRYASPLQRDVAELVSVRADGSDAQLIARSDAGYPFFSYNWTSAGRIIYSEGVRKPGGIDWFIQELPTSGAGQNKIFGPHSTPIRIIQEINSSEMGALAVDPQTGLAQLWVFNRNGDIRRVTNDTSQFKYVSLASSAHRMLATRVETDDTLWVANASQEQGSRNPATVWEKLDLPQGGYNNPVWTPDGNIVYVALSGGGNNEIWWIKADGTGQRRLTSNGADNRNERVSPDGKFVVYTVDRNGSKSIWRIDIDGSDPRKLTEGGTDEYPEVSPDGKWVVYVSAAAGQWSAWKVSSGGGTPIRIADSVLKEPRVSPDGKLIALEHVSPSNRELRWGIFSFQDGSLVRDLEMPPNLDVVSWSADCKSLLYLVRQTAPEALWSQPITGESPRKIMDLAPGEVEDVNWSKDGKKMILLRRNLKIDLVLIDEVN